MVIAIPPAPNTASCSLNGDDVSSTPDTSAVLVLKMPKKSRPASSWKNAHPKIKAFVTPERGPSDKGFRTVVKGLGVCTESEYPDFYEIVTLEVFQSFNTIKRKGLLAYRLEVPPVFFYPSTGVESPAKTIAESTHPYSHAQPHQDEPPSASNYGIK